MKKIGYPQYIQYLTYLDCKKRTKKQVGLPNDENYMSDDEKLVRFLLENSSITERNGEWCTRSHCQYYSSKRAYNCHKTRPKVCKEYARYIAGVEERKNKRTTT